MVDGNSPDREMRHSPGEYLGSEKKALIGDPNAGHMSELC